MSSPDSSKQLLPASSPPASPPSQPSPSLPPPPPSPSPLLSPSSSSLLPTPPPLSPLCSSGQNPPPSHSSPSLLPLSPSPPPSSSPLSTDQNPPPSHSSPSLLPPSLLPSSSPFSTNQNLPPTHPSPSLPLPPPLSTNQNLPPSYSSPSLAQTPPPLSPSASPLSIDQNISTQQQSLGDETQIFNSMPPNDVKRKRNLVHKDARFFHGPSYGLPKDWLIEIRPRTLDKYRGKIDQFYYEPDAGKQFRSLKSVEQHLGVKFPLLQLTDFSKITPGGLEGPIISQPNKGKGKVEGSNSLGRNKIPGSMPFPSTGEKGIWIPYGPRLILSNMFDSIEHIHPAFERCKAHAKNGAERHKARAKPSNTIGEDSEATISDNDEMEKENREEEVAMVMNNDAKNKKEEEHGDQSELKEAAVKADDKEMEMENPADDLDEVMKAIQ